ncbi:MAG: undecaprenyl-diphosphate phosphatase [Bacteroidales bacterium]|nr:undecaprenyl-diphosphate phosphatase [Bacteroidales bacterium]
MDVIQALILGIIQGLTEFLPVSSSGHLEIGKVLLGVDVEESLSFSVAVHGATVLSTIVVFWKDIVSLIKGFFKFRWNEETKFIALIAVSMIPVGIVGVFFKDSVESLFSGKILLVGFMLLVTAILLTLATVIKRKRETDITFRDALIIGVAQAIAVIPGISRSGATIATGLMLGKRRPEVARFSFLMVLIPILGANFLDIMSGSFSSEAGAGVLPIFVGFISAFVVGVFACKIMIKLINQNRLIWFALYCVVVATIAIVSFIL